MFSLIALLDILSSIRISWSHGLSKHSVSFYATDYLEPKAISNSHFIAVMDSVNELLVKGTVRTNCSLHHKPQLGTLRGDCSLEHLWQGDILPNGVFPHILASGLDLLTGASPHGLSTWWGLPREHGGWILKGSNLQREHDWSESGKNWVAFPDLVSEVTAHNFHWLLIRKSQHRLALSQGGSETPPLRIGVSKNLQIYFKTSAMLYVICNYIPAHSFFNFEISDTIFVMDKP